MGVWLNSQVEKMGLEHVSFEVVIIPKAFRARRLDAVI